MTSTTSAGATGDVIRSDRRGRLLIRAEQRSALLDAFESSALSGMAFCRQHGLSYSTFANWIQARRKASIPAKSLPAPVPQPAFAEVIVGENPSAVSKPPVPLRVSLRGGVSFEITGPEQIPLVAGLIQSLGGGRPC